MKESTLIKMQKDIQSLNNLCNALATECMSLKSSQTVVYQILQKMPNFTEIVQEINEQQLEAQKEKAESTEEQT